MAAQKNDKFWRNLDLLISCPVCKKRLGKSIFLCASGHSICNICINKSSICSQCRAPYTKIPNLLAQNLLLKYDNLKEHCGILENNDKKTKELFPLVKKNIYKSSLNINNNNEYRCWIFDDCKFTSDASMMIEHFKNSHQYQFEEHINGHLPYTKSYEMDYFIGKNFDRAVKIGGLLFIVHISINGMGELGACILMYTSHGIADYHVCQIEIECALNKSCYKNAKVISARSSEKTVLGFKRSGLQFVRNINLYNALRVNKRFRCTVLLQRRNQTKGGNIKVPQNEIQKIVPKHYSSMISIAGFEVVNNDQIVNDDELNGKIDEGKKIVEQEILKVDDSNDKTPNLNDLRLSSTETTIDDGNSPDECVIT
ncbi:hypothetical protein PV328_007994 [Microctonus aethiopoides]|uniref:E3 ubiquitin-protein ligase Sina-like RING finger domain-containing protein n=1 Tax=Microctonus aethiopoides TaxID=144406 RepID=A0AA39CAE5_9HYME|nr:hypothetical protein PV328_007994 [Microctonus aethiopoides]